jgi:hypothetical protein
VNLTSGGVNANKTLVETLKKLDNVKNLEIIVVFTRFKSFRIDVENELSTNDARFDDLDIEEREKKVNKEVAQKI